MQVELKEKRRQTTPPRGAKTPSQHTTESSNMAKWVYTFGDGAAGPGYLKMPSPMMPITIR